MQEFELRVNEHVVLSFFQDGREGKGEQGRKGGREEGSKGRKEKERQGEREEG